MTIYLGPILGFQGYDEATSTWKLSAIVVADAAPGELTASAKTQDAAVVKPTVLWTLGKKSVYRYEFSARLQAKESKLTYEVAGQRNTIALPAKGMMPWMFYTSCNGFSSLKVMKTVSDKNAMWDCLDTEYKKRPHHLLVMGGDQVYADSMWETVPTMKRWNELSFAKGNDAAFTGEMRAELETFYFELYCERWSQSSVAKQLARIPTLMMWDDHDIIDGWGSYPEKRQNCDVYKGLFKIARKAFAVFQRHLPENAEVGACGHGYTWAHQIGRLAIIGLDMRSERSAVQVMSPPHWDAVYKWMDGLKEVDHLLVVSSIPVVYPSFDMIEGLLGFTPGQQELEDDLRDHWNSRPHKNERLRLIQRLLSVVVEKNIRPTILSGDVHVAALGVVESFRESTSGGKTPAINQLISSAIVHPGPPAIMLFALRHLFDGEDEVERGITARMTTFPGTKTGFIGKRNFLALQPDEGVTAGARLWANWYVEGEDAPYTKVINPEGAGG